MVIKWANAIPGGESDDLNFRRRIRAMMEGTSFHRSAKVYKQADLAVAGGLSQTSITRLMTNGELPSENLIRELSRFGVAESDVKALLAERERVYLSSRGVQLDAVNAHVLEDLREQLQAWEAGEEATENYRRNSRLYSRTDRLAEPLLTIALTDELSPAELGYLLVSAIKQGGEGEYHRWAQRCAGLPEAGECVVDMMLARDAGRRPPVRAAWVLQYFDEEIRAAGLKVARSISEYRKDGIRGLIDAVEAGDVETWAGSHSDVVIRGLLTEWMRIVPQAGARGRIVALLNSSTASDDAGS